MALNPILGCIGSGTGVCSQDHGQWRHVLPIWHWLESCMRQRPQAQVGSLALVQLNNDKTEVMNTRSLLPGGNNRTWECWKNCSGMIPQTLPSMRNWVTIVEYRPTWQFEDVYFPLKMMISTVSDSRYFLCHQHNSSLAFVQLQLVSLVRWSSPSDLLITTVIYGERWEVEHVHPISVLSFYSNKPFYNNKQG